MADRQQNMGLYFGADTYKSRTRIAQAPGGSTSFSLGWDNSSPFEDARPKQQKPERQQRQHSFDNHNSHRQYDNQNTNRALQRVSSNYAPSREPIQPINFKATYHGFSQPVNMTRQEYNAPKQEYKSPERYENSGFENLVQKSWEDASYIINQKPTITGRTPLELAYLRHKNDPNGAYFREREPREAFRPYEPRMNYLSAAVTELRPKNQLSSIQNNYNNIVNNFSNNKEYHYADNGLPNHNRARDNNVFPDNTGLWSGKKALQPPGGGSSFKLWG